MKFRNSILFKWSLGLLLIYLPIYITSVRMDRLLEEYTHKSNATYILKTKIADFKIQNDIIITDGFYPVKANVEKYIVVLFILKSFTQLRKFYIYSDLPPPSTC